jgi:hypothetical protein
MELPQDDSDDEVVIINVVKKNRPSVPRKAPSIPRKALSPPYQGQEVIDLMDSDTDDDKERSVKLTATVGSPMQPEVAQSSQIARSAPRAHQMFSATKLGSSSPSLRGQMRSSDGGVRYAAASAFGGSPPPNVSSLPNNTFCGSEDSDVELISVRAADPFEDNEPSDESDVVEVSAPLRQLARIRARQSKRDPTRGAQEAHRGQHQQHRRKRRQQQLEQHDQQQHPRDLIDLTACTCATAAHPQWLPGGPSAASAAGAAQVADLDRDYDSSDDEQAMVKESALDIVGVCATSPFSSPESKTARTLEQFLKKPPPTRPHLTVETARPESPLPASAPADGHAGTSDLATHRNDRSVPKTVEGRAARVIRKDKAQSKEKLKKLENRAKAKNRTLDPETKEVVRKVGAWSSGTTYRGAASDRTMRASSNDAIIRSAFDGAVLDAVPPKKVQAAGEHSAETDRSTATDDVSHHSTMEESATSVGGSGGTVAMDDVENFSDFESSQPALGSENDDVASEGGGSASAALAVCRAAPPAEAKKSNDVESSQSSFVGVGGVSVANGYVDFEAISSHGLGALKRAAVSPPDQSSVFPRLMTPVWWDEANSDLANLAAIDGASSSADDCSEDESDESADELESTHARLPGTMHVVEHLTKCYVSKDGNPVKEFVVYGTEDGEYQSDLILNCSFSFLTLM